MVFLKGIKIEKTCNGINERAYHHKWTELKGSWEGKLKCSLLFCQISFDSI